jgi:hypothetical protein
MHRQALKIISPLPSFISLFGVWDIRAGLSTQPLRHKTDNPLQNHTFTFTVLYLQFT